GTATPSTTDEGFLWYDENDTPPTPKFWDGAAFQALTSGKILQVVRATDSTDRTTSSGTYVDVTGMSVSITPTKTTSAVLVLALFVSNVYDGSSSLAEGLYQITDSSNNPSSGAQEAEHRIDVSGGSGVTTRGPLIIAGYATPGTTSSVTYKLRFRQISATSVTVRNSKNTGQMYAMEVSA
ncbi:MAG TPA: hypothetical protein VIG24_09850, partial [Acidimicrobiia bacterium]